jgi:hypothetical protein
MRRFAGAALVAAGIAAAGLWLHGERRFGRDASFLWLVGAALGIVFQRGQLCFNAALREVVLRGERRAATGLLAALAAGGAGYAAVFLAQLPDPTRYLPETAHLAPAGWVPFVGGLVFGFGMILGGGCISGHLFRLGEGRFSAVPGLLAVIPGAWIGQALWNPVYLAAISSTPVVWLPRHLGYAGSLGLHLAVLGGIALLLARRTSLPPPPEPPVPGAAGALSSFFVRPWPAPSAGLALGMIGVFAFLVVEPLGVTGPFGRWARESSRALGFGPERLEGLDRLAGCRAITSKEWLTPMTLLVAAIPAGSFAAALASGRFRPRRPGGAETLRAAAGGLLLGVSATLSLGCTIGTLLSGAMAFSLHAWHFGAGLVLGGWAAARLVGRDAAVPVPCTAP